MYYTHNNNYSHRLPHPSVSSTFARDFFWTTTGRDAGEEEQDV